MTAVPKLLILGAHPDDAEYHAGGLAAIYRSLGRPVKLVSVTNGGAGHHRLASEELVRTRRAEAKAAGDVIGAEYVTWDFPDGGLQPTLEVRDRIIREIRTWQPDLVLTHRINDYHPDHRAVGQAVQDASYMVTVPLVVTDTPYLRKDPVVAYMTDLFTRPCPLEPQITIDITPHVDEVVAMLACHACQVFDFLPYNHNIDPPPTAEPARRNWLRDWFRSRSSFPRCERFRDALIAAYGQERGSQIEFAEFYEISEYAASLSDQEKDRLFPQAGQTEV
ncbi:PIG-L deacetylase family protein [Lignipirellula cremea]|uniref:1D-myo-inositol 2-acetamido-2-deoxy-alpha-D-glucopyranoside deacetylase n=1 Tax=Lignipirellula cremea TaxID=2528010 RepID=A0A518DMG1_9BACT|nr:PIG-L deacetylase family protein [Lignipirellula cremea]QDU93030.1 1D-myo-inositol 2-acetamido-2-deoxy-alpha-D-glucopyranoside deacetylase [Lignipirellula cremea]